MNLHNIKHLKGWFRLGLIFTPFTVYFIVRYFHNNFEWSLFYTDLHYIKIEIITGSLLGLFIHFLAIILILYLTNWIISGFRED